MDELLGTEEVTKELNAARQMQMGDPISKTTGCTANVVLITPTQYIVANAGDSRSSLCREGKAIDLSLDHKPQSQEEEKRIKNAGGVIYMGRVNGGLNLSRSFGDFDYKSKKELGYHEQMITCKPDIRIFQRHPSDEFIIVGCDGIWERYVDNSQGLIDIIKGHIGSAKPNKKIMEELLDELIAKDTMSGIGCDNMTAILIKIK